MSTTSVNELCNEISELFNLICKNHSSNSDQRTRFMEIIQVFRTILPDNAASSDLNMTTETAVYNMSRIENDILEIKASFSSALNEINSKFPELTSTNAILQDFIDKIILPTPCIQTSTETSIQIAFQAIPPASTTDSSESTLRSTISYAQITSHNLHKSSTNSSPESASTPTLHNNNTAMRAITAGSNASSVL